MLLASVLLLCVVVRKQLATCWLGLCMGTFMRASVCLWQLYVSFAWTCSHGCVTSVVGQEPLPALPCPALPYPAQSQEDKELIHIQLRKCYPVDVRICNFVVYVVWGSSHSQHSSKLPHQDSSD